MRHATKKVSSSQLSATSLCATGLWIVILMAASGVGAQAAPPETPATYLGDDSTCLSCHEDQMLAADQPHARIERFEVRGHVVGCEGCHGPGADHVEELDPELIGTFAPGGWGDRACLSCHQAKGLGQWHASTHAAENVGCVDCHTVHSTDVGETRTVAYDACRGCHGEVFAELQLPSHHPVREAKMDCASCHDPHAASERMLRAVLRVNDLCTDCHQEKEGPFLFEHEPVQEDCRTCHVPHGSVADNLLVANEPALCLQCHEPHFHSGYRASESHAVDVGGFERENPWGVEGMNLAFTTNCSQCHSQVHGSDLPSQTVPGQGRGLGN